ncbi:MAG: sensor histidine kinase [Lachnospiraceae bacterium]
MKKKYVSNGKKMAVLCLQGVLSIAIVVSLFILGFLVRDQVIGVGSTAGQKFEESQMFQNQFEDSVKEIEHLFFLKNIFEGEEGYDSNKVIGISEYAALKGNRQLDPPQNPGFSHEKDPDLSYPVSTLEEWAKRGYQQQTFSCKIHLSEKNGVYTQDGAIWVGNRKLKSFHQTLHQISDLDIELYNRGVQELSNQVEEPLLNLDDPTAPVEEFLSRLNWTDQTIRTYGKILEEQENPSVGKTLKQQILDRELTIEQAERTSMQLKQVLDEILEDASEYHRLHTTYEKQDCNFYFWIQDKEQKTIRTNCTDISERAVEAFGKEKGACLYWNTQQDRFFTNVKGVRSFIYGKGKQLQSFSGYSEMMFAVDTEYPYEDAFRDTKEEYESLCPLIWPAILTSLLGSMLWLVCILFLTSASGHTLETALQEEQTGKEVIQLNMYDRIKTEFLIAGFILFLAAMICLYIRLVTGNMWKIPGIFIMAGTLTTVGFIGGAIQYLSLVRRIKARTLWTDSLLYVFCGIAKKAFLNRRLTVQLLLIYGAQIILTVGFSYLAFAKKSKMGMVLFCMDLAIEGVLYIRESMQRKRIMQGVQRISSGELEYQISTDGFYAQNKKLAEGINRIGEGLQNAVDASMKNERMKADLITNVSHDIKTPLTSIINYTNLIKMQHIEDETTNRYVDILMEKSQRLKQLTEDLVEASKISSGNITLEMMPIDMLELIYQTAGEFNEKFEEKQLMAVTKLPKESVMIEADGRRIWRVIENLYNNVAKYAMERTRVYVELKTEDDMAVFSIRNISQQEIKVKGEELTERFTRGDESRSTEGSGLGLSIARNLTVLMNGTMQITVDGDIFRVEIRFPLLQI